MIADLMPRWLYRLLDMDRATVSGPYTGPWTWRHFCRYGRDPGKTADDCARYTARLAAATKKPRR